MFSGENFVPHSIEETQVEFEDPPNCISVCTSLLAAINRSNSNSLVSSQEPFILIYTSLTHTLGLDIESRLKVVCTLFLTEEQSTLQLITAA